MTRSTDPTLADAVAPLRWIFWGGLLCVLDFTISSTTNGTGFRFDVLNDAVGAGLVAAGVWSLARQPVDEVYERAMAFVRVVAILAFFAALLHHVVFQAPPVVSFGLTLLSLAEVVAIVVFCRAMVRLCGPRCPRAAESWGMTSLLFVLIYLVPLGLFYLAGLAAIATGQSFHIDLGPAGLLLIPVFLVPVIHLFVSTSRMKREILARNRAGLFLDPDPPPAAPLY